MGGDDLASEDEYIYGSGGPLGSDSDNDSVSSEIDGNQLKSSSNKRKGKNTDKLTSDEIVPSSKKRRKKKKDDAPVSSKSLLILAGRGIALDSAESQVKFINTLYSHSMKMSGNNEADTFSFTPEHFYTTPPGTDEKVKQFQHKNLDAFLKGPVTSMKRLKNWKHECSPMVIIVTLSARRSVELMKELSSLKLPIAKLFAKHFSVEEQVELLKGPVKGSGGGGKKRSERCYSIAVGTPGRLLTLLQHGRNEHGSDGLGALRLNHTEVVIFDTHEDSKGFNVCTLKDTSSDLMHFMKEGVVPQLERKKSNLTISMF
eukprot:scaffold6987_cov128-Skeletonema_dohrnii-CCMP3373.AAC.7